MTRRPVFAVLSVVVVLLALTQLALYVDASFTSNSHFDPTHPHTFPHLHPNALHGLWLLSMPIAVLLTIAYAGGARIRAAAVTAVGASCLGVSLWTTPFQLGAFPIPSEVRGNEMLWAVALCGIAVIAFATARGVAFTAGARPEPLLVMERVVGGSIE